MAVSGTGPLLEWNDDLMYDDSSRINLEGYKTSLGTNIPKDSSESASYCIRTMTQNTLTAQSRSLSGQRNGKSQIAQINLQI